MQELNSEQKEAVFKKSGPVLVLAGAGSGKTRTLTERIIHLIEGGIQAQEILALTFTNKAAQEMKERVSSGLSSSHKINFPVFEAGFLPFVSTFHSLGVFILRENYRELGISKYFSIYNRADSHKIIKEALEQMGLDSKDWDKKKILSIISKQKSKLVSLEEFLGEQQSIFGKKLAEIWSEYEKIKGAEKALDFDDLISETAFFLEKNPKAQKHYQEKWSHIHVDEYQDTNMAQYKILESLVHPRKRNIFAVGDPDQNIYSWRGADIKNILSFERDFPGGKSIILEQNYRSSGNILKASNGVIEKNKERFPKKLFTEKGPGEKIGLFIAGNEKGEAFFVAEKAKEIIGSGVSENQIAVLYRTNFQSRVLEEFFLKAGISYQVLGTKFFERKEVKDAISYLKLSLNPESLVDLKRAIASPRRGIGKVSLSKILAGKEESLSGKQGDSYEKFQKIIKSISEYTAGGASPREIISFTLDHSGLAEQFLKSKTEESMERLGNLYELESFAQKYDSQKGPEGLFKFLEEVSLLSDQDQKDEKKPAVKLMTIHAAKGLEFDYIFLTGCEDELFSPILEKEDPERKREEERRLFYVAMTRARKKLRFSWAETRSLFGKRNLTTPCPFISDISDDFLELENLGQELEPPEEEEVVYLDF